MSALRRFQWTEADYLALDSGSDIKYEYLFGEVYAMAGASFSHTIIATNIGACLRPQLRGKGCTIHSSDLRVKIPLGNYFYPDLAIVCGQPHLEWIKGVHTLFNPTIIIEILSPSTQNFDATDKALQYRLIPSLREYWLIHTNEAKVVQEVLLDGSWIPSITTTQAQPIRIASLNSVITLADIYEDVDFSETT